MATQEALTWPSDEFVNGPGKGPRRGAPWRCPSCEGATWLSYRCTECGFDLVDQHLTSIPADLFALFTDTDGDA